MLAALQPVIYIQVSPDRVTLRNARTGEVICEVPEVAITREPKAKVLAVGAEARKLGSAAPVAIVNPFGHPRSLVSDFTAGEQLLKSLLCRAQGRSLLAIAPRVVLHPQGSPAGGFTQVEVRAFQEMALGAGASKVEVWHGRTLTDQELLSRQFPNDGQVLS